MIHKKTKFCFVLFLGISLATAEAQVAVTSAGGNGTNSTGFVSYTVGQLLYNTNAGSSGSVAQGVQQPYEISEVLALEEIQGLNIKLYAYPNPTTDYITLKIENEDKHELSYQIFDTRESVLSNVKIYGSETNIKLSNFVTGIYFLKIVKKNKEVKTFKIIKK